MEEKKTRICWGQSLFSPEAVICLGRRPTLNHCVCFYGLSGFVCAPQPLKLVWGAADFCPNLGIVKPHCFLTLERRLASHMGRWGAVYTVHQLRGSMQMSLGCVLVWILLWSPNPELKSVQTVWRWVTSLLARSTLLLSVVVLLKHISAKWFHFIICKFSVFGSPPSLCSLTTFLAHKIAKPLYCKATLERQTFPSGVNGRRNGAKRWLYGGSLLMLFVCMFAVVS